MSSPVVELRIMIPRELRDKLVAVAEKNGITVEDLILRALVKAMEEMG